MRKRSLILAVLVATSLGCFEIQGKHTIYLEPDGTVTWSVLEEEIRLDGETLEERRRAADEFLDLVAANGHAAAVSLAALHPSSLNTRILREEAPQAILTEAHFPGIDRVYQNLYDLYDLPALAELESDEDRTRLRIWMWKGGEDEDEPDGSEESERVSLEILAALIGECRIVLTEGRFVEATGFEILQNGRVAVPADFETTEEQDEGYVPVVLSLTWAPEPEDPAATGTAHASQLL